MHWDALCRRSVHSVMAFSCLCWIPWKCLLHARSNLTTLTLREEVKDLKSRTDDLRQLLNQKTAAHQKIVQLSQFCLAPFPSHWNKGWLFEVPWITRLRILEAWQSFRELQQCFDLCCKILRQRHLTRSHAWHKFLPCCWLFCVCLSVTLKKLDFSVSCIMTDVWHDIVEWREASTWIEAKGRKVESTWSQKWS